MSRNRRRTRLLTWILAGTLALGLPLTTMTGCPKPGDTFNSFVERTEGIDGGMAQPDLPPSMIFDISGTFLLAVSTFLAPNRPIQALLTTVLTQNEDGTATLDITIQPLSAMGREPVGKSTTVSGVAVAADGSFEIPLSMQPFPGASNPITGSDLLVDIVLRGTIRSEDRFCGDITGMVLEPLMLELDDTGSVWGAIRVEKGQTGDALPKPDYSCPAGEKPDGGPVPDAGPDAEQDTAPDTAPDAGPDADAAGDAPADAPADAPGDVPSEATAAG
jgi:hypothetical protein